MPNVPATLKNAVVVIAGASSGFGRGAALELAKRGAKVVVAARRTNLLESLVTDIHAAGGDGLAVTVDVSDPEEVESLARQTIERYGRIDVWVNNVGVGAIGYLWDIPLETHARVVDVNLKGLIYGMHTAIRQFIQQGGGTLINVGSIDSQVPLALQNTYAATKAAVLSLSRSVGEELRLAGHSEMIRIATIMPWAIDTPWWTHAANYSGHEPRMVMMDDPMVVVEEIIKACTDPHEEMPVGPKARAADISHHLFPDMTERMTANIAKAEAEKGTPVPTHDGTLFTPMQEGDQMSGGIRERMKWEDSQA